MNPFSNQPEAKPRVSAEEYSTFSAYFDSLEKIGGIATGDSVIRFLSSAKLTNSQLSSIWELSGGLVRVNGLDLEEFCVACKLVALYQSGLPAKLRNLGVKTELPVFGALQRNNQESQAAGQAFLVPQKTGQQNSMTGYQQTGLQQPMLVPQRTGQSTPVFQQPLLVPQRTGQSEISRNPSIMSPYTQMVCTPEEKTRFTGFFQVSGPVDGYLPGAIAKDIFVKSGLSNDILSKVWALVDKDGLGKFSVHSFITAMWIITKLKMNVISEVPLSIPASLLNSILGGDAKLVSVPNSAASSPVMKILPSSSLSSSYTAGLSESERNQYGAYFDSIDTAKKGVLNGQECFPIFLKSNLSNQELGQIWELVDISKSGSINKEGFVTAMHLIKKRIGGATIPNQSNSLMDLSTTSSQPASIGPKIPTDSELLRGLAPLSSVPSSLSNISNQIQPSPLASMPLPISQQPAMNLLSLEAKEVSIREQQLFNRQSEVSVLNQQLMDLKPNAEELKQKRDQIDAEYRKMNEKRMELSLELTQLRAEYELGLETLKDRQDLLARDLVALQVSGTEVQQYKDAIMMITKETKSLQEKIDKQKLEMEEMQIQAKSFGEETAKLREANQKVFEESRALQQQFDLLEKTMENGKDEYRIVKENLDLEGSRLEQDRKKVQALEQQVSVQNAITERERLRVLEAEKERKELEARNRDLMAAEAKLKKRQIAEQELESKKIEDEKKSAAEAKEILEKAILPAEVVIPENEPPPPIPSLLKKPTLSSKDNIIEAIAKESSSPMSTLSAPAAVQEKIPSKKDQESMELDNLLLANKLKSSSLDEKTSKPVSSVPDYESFFANPEPVTIASQPVEKKSSAEDIKKAMEKAFANTTLKAAKDTPSLSSSSTVKRTAAPADKFKFDSSFSAPQPLKSGATVKRKTAENFGNFEGASFTGFKPQPQNAFPQDLDSVFGGASIPAPSGFIDDPFAGSNAFASVTGLANSSKSNVAIFSNDPFGASNFDKSPFPPPIAIKSGEPSKGKDTPEVLSITSMGFTREQAVNALEIQGQDVQKAINYLLESTAK